MSVVEAVWKPDEVKLKLEEAPAEAAAAEATPAGVEGATAGSAAPVQQATATAENGDSDKVV